MSNQDLDIVEQQQQQQQLQIPERPLHRRSFPICPKCNQSCTKDDGEFVRAFNQVYHYKCFICEDCLQPVADKYYPIIDEQPQQKGRNNRKKLVLCEFHHMKRLGLICLKCNKPITTPEQKFHPQCIQCPSCITPTVSQYEFKGISYCRIHYSLIQETHCAGCDQAILKQFVENRDLPNKIWHPECYMIYKFWGVKLAPNPGYDESKLIDIQIQADTKVTRVWTDLSSFEESSANCISDMLLNVAAGAYIEGIRMANQFIMHLQVLFSALDIIRNHLALHKQELNCNMEADLVCKQMIRFFQLLTVPSKTDMSITQELLSLVTGLAQNLKSLIRIGLSAALHLEREIGIENAIPEFLNQLLELEKKRVWIAGRYWFKDPPSTKEIDTTAENCHVCHLVIEDTDCYENQDQHLKWHPACFSCATCSIRLNEKTALLNTTTLYCQSCCCATPAQTCTHVTLLQQYLYNLKLYIAKLSSTSSSSSSTFIAAVAANNKSLSNEIIMPETKRQRSILRMLGNRSQTPKPTMNRFDSVHLGQIQRTSSTTLEEEDNSKSSFYSKKKANNLMISTDSQQQEQQSSPTSPVMVIPKTTNRITSSIRRTFSTNSHSSSTKQRISLYGVFDRKREARRASVLTLDDTGHSTNKTIYISILTPMQDFIVRHVALIAIQPLIQFSLDELIGLIETKKQKKSSSSSKKRNSTTMSSPTEHHNPASALWGKLITHIKASTSTTVNNNNKNKTFGVSLSTLITKEHEDLKQQKNDDSGGVTLCDFTPALAASFSDNALIPIFVKSCIMAILQSDMSIEGVFRKNGNIRQLKTLSESIDNIPTTSSATMDQLLSTENSVQLAALLKRYLRELPEPLMTFSLYKLFVQCGKSSKGDEERKRILHLACCLLPKANRDIMLLIFCCLKWVATFSDTNKMDIPNLARVIAPNVLYSSASTSSTADLRQGAQEEINVIETLIREADQISIIPSELVLLSLQDNVNQDMSDLNSRYFIKQYIQLLTELRNRKSKSENNSPVSTTTNKKLTQSSLLSKYQIGVPKPLNISANNTTNSPTAISPSSPIPTPSKQRRTSWIPGLVKK